MAKIGKISLKSVKTGVGHDRCGFTSNIYLGTKKIGTFDNDGYGGDSEISILPDYREAFKEEVEKYIKRPEIRKHLLYANEYGLLEYLLQLHEYECDFKKTTKKGYVAIAVATPYGIDKDGLLDITSSQLMHLGAFDLPTANFEKHKEFITNKYKPLLDEGKIHSINITIFSDLNDFIIQ